MASGCGSFVSRLGNYLLLESKLNSKEAGNQPLPAKLPAYASPVIQAQAKMTNGQIAYVEFFAGTNYLGRDTTASTNAAGMTNIFEQELSGLAPGKYELSARAADTNSPPRTRTSASVTITVADPVPVASTGAWDPGFGYTPALSDTVFLALNDGSDSVSGTFNSLPEGGLIPSAGGSWQISYLANGDAGTVGNDIALTFIPEPSAALLAGLGALLAARRRR